MKKEYLYKKKGPIKNWHEGLMLGNGTIGALIYGEKDLVFSLDRVDLWDNRKTSEMKEKGFTFQNMIKTMKEDWNEYLRLFNNCYEHPYPTKINAGSLVFENVVNPRTQFIIDIKKAEYSIENNNDSFSGYLDANSNVLIIKCSKTAQFKFVLPEYLHKNEENRGLGYEDYQEFKEENYRYLIQKTKASFSFAILTYDTIVNDERYVLATILKSNHIEEEIEAWKSYLESYLNCQEVFKQFHDKYWHDYYSTSDIKTNDLMIDRLYNLSRYFFACNSKGKYPMALEGVWTRNDGNLPPWKGDYHMDINLEMSYEAYMKTGNFAEGEVLLNYLWDNRNIFKKLAKEFCKAKGLFIPGVMTQDCTPLGGWPMYSLNPCCQIWITKAFDDYYKYTGSKKFLRERAYPFFKGIEECISSLLVEKDGYLQLPFSVSPELYECDPSSILPSQSNFEIAMLHYLYKTLIEFSHVLNSDCSYYEQCSKKIRDFSINSKGEFNICEALLYNTSHRHFSHILSHKNLELLSPYKDVDQIQRDLALLEKVGTEEWVGFSFTEASSLASYIGLGEKAYDFAYKFADGFVNDNGFHMNMDFKNKGYSTIHSYAFTLEANMGYLRAITDMMLRTTDDVITIFPAIPNKFKDVGVSFKNLRAHFNKYVSASISNGKLSFKIKTHKKSKVSLFNNISNKFDLLVDGELKHYEAPIGSIITIEANKNIIYKE